MLRRIVITTGLIVLSAISALEAEAAGLRAQNIPGASCKPAYEIDGDWYEYYGRALVNLTSEPLGAFIAVCPLSEFAPKWTSTELRVVFNDPDQAEAWCAVYDQSGEEIDFGYVDFTGSQGIYGTAVAESAVLNATVYCVVNAGASLETIEVIWSEGE